MLFTFTSFSYTYVFMNLCSAKEEKRGRGHSTWQFHKKIAWCIAARFGIVLTIFFLFENPNYKHTGKCWLQVSFTSSSIAVFAWFVFFGWSSWVHNSSHLHNLMAFHQANKNNNRAQREPKRFFSTLPLSLTTTKTHVKVCCFHSGCTL